MLWPVAHNQKRKIISNREIHWALQMRIVDDTFHIWTSIFHNKFFPHLLAYLLSYFRRNRRKKTHRAINSISETSTFSLIYDNYFCNWWNWNLFLINCFNLQSQFEFLLHNLMHELFLNTTNAK